MGLERLVSILQKKMSNYDIDLFQDIFEGIAKITNTRPYEGKFGAEDADNHDTAFRVIADHVRMLSVAIADGQKPGPDGTGYVLRRVIRRATRFASEALQAPPGLLSQLVPYVVATLGASFPTLVEHQDDIMKALKYEEQLFARTLQNGLRQFSHIVRRLPEGVDEFPPQDAANLFTTFGFPVDLTRVKAEEEKLKLNEGAVQKLLDVEKEISEKARLIKKESDAAAVNMDPNALSHLASGLGVAVTNDSYKYEQEDITARVCAIYKPGSAENFGFVNSVRPNDGTYGVFLDRTNFYAESGGQHYDQGVITKQDAAVVFEVENVQSFGGYVYHSGSIAGNGELHVGDTVNLSVNLQRRQPIAANHTCTHVLNYSLRKWVGDHCEQKGSLVLPNRFRFDYIQNSPLTVQHIFDVQKEVNIVAEKNQRVYVELVPLDKAKEIYGVRCLFDEHYPNPVRVVSVGVEVSKLLADPTNKDWANYSVEFCGGTHLSRTSEICNFVLISDEAVAAGVRRITAVTGAEALEALDNKEAFSQRLKNLDRANLAQSLKELREDLDRIPMPADARIEFRTQLENWGKEVAKDLKSKKNEASEVAKSFADETIASLKQSGTRFFVADLPVAQGKNVLLTNAIKAITADLPDVSVLLFSVDDSNKDPSKHKVTIVAHAPDKVVAEGFKADEWAKVAAAVVGGKGGGKATTAQGAGPHVNKVSDAVAAANDFANKFFAK